MTDAPRPEDIDDHEDVYDLLSSLSDRDFEGMSFPDGETVWFKFTDSTYRESYRLEVNVYSGNLWLHHDAVDGETETLWKNKRRY